MIDVAAREVMRFEWIAGNIDARFYGCDSVIDDHADRHFAQALGLPSFATGGVHYLKRLTLIILGGYIKGVIYPVYRPAEHAFELLGRFELRD